MKEGTGDITLLITDHLLAGIKQSCCGRSDGHDGEAADKPQNVQPDTIYDFGYKLKNRAFRIKETTHDQILLWLIRETAGLSQREQFCSSDPAVKYG